MMEEEKRLAYGPPSPFNESLNFNPYADPPMDDEQRQEESERPQVRIVNPRAQQALKELLEAHRNPAPMPTTPPASGQSDKTVDSSPEKVSPPKPIASRKRRLV